MERCTICREAEASPDRGGGGPSTCPPCGRLFQWFLDLYADVEFRVEGWITPETEFFELIAESLDYVEWQLVAEERFGVTIPDRVAEGMVTVGDFLRHIRLQGKAKAVGPASGMQDPLWDRSLDR